MAPFTNPQIVGALFSRIVVRPAEIFVKHIGSIHMYILGVYVR